MKIIKNVSERSAKTEHIYLEFKDRVYQYIKSRTEHPEAAEDLLSCVFLKIQERIDTYDHNKASLSTWIYAITRNTLNDYLRRQYKVKNKELYADVIADYAEDDLPVLEKIIMEEQLENLAVALERLPEREREIIILRFYYERTSLQVASIMRLSHENVRYLQHVAIGKLKKIMAML